MARIIDSRIVGHAEEIHEKTWRPHHGIVTSRSEGMAIENVHFYNFVNGNEKYYCIFTCS